MSATLAIDCAMRHINIGLCDAEKLLGSISINSGPKQSERLPGLVAEFLACNGLSLADVGRIAVTPGPGYYTGIRVGLSYASALAESLSVGLVPISTLEALAYGFERSEISVVSLMKARRNAVYCAGYRGGENFLPPSFMEVRELVEILESDAAASRRAEEGARFAPLLIGEDVTLFPELTDIGCDFFTGRPDIGANMIGIATVREEIDPASVKAVYLRNPD